MNENAGELKYNSIKKDLTCRIHSDHLQSFARSLRSEQDHCIEIIYKSLRGSSLICTIGFPLSFLCPLSGSASSIRWLVRWPSSDTAECSFVWEGNASRVAHQNECKFPSRCNLLYVDSPSVSRLISGTAAVAILESSGRLPGCWTCQVV